jgi:predicted DNA-binding transcriptional regulator AlpA
MEIKVKQFPAGPRYYRNGIRVDKNGVRYHPSPCKGRPRHVNPNELLSDPALAADACAAAKQTALLAFSAAQTAIAASGLTEEETPQTGSAPDRLLDVKEAAARLNMSQDRLYRKKDLPFVVRISPRCVRFSERGIERYIYLKSA